ncbi:DUF2806 domain-containing protein [Candidatus Minimicrobia vallesae]|uniref:DUF2806 domain-containing protein n=1 Tax=Candidatus Minimicrobia vallesae TaxID=2841264 RepID=A0A8F1SA29_9BACT|nr:DUF2806 domain-containing protein [Candidatus Minimicrobia vallesae]
MRKLEQRLEFYMLARCFMLCQFKEKGIIMAQNLGKLLGGDVKKRRALTELRQMTRDDSDVRLIAEILARAHSIICISRFGSVKCYGRRNLSIFDGYRAEG